MRRAVAVLCAAAVLFGGGVLAVAVARSRGAATTPLASGITRATRFYGVGPSAEYHFDSGDIGTVAPLHLSFPAGTTYDVVATVSLDYHTTADDRFVLGLSARRDSEFGHAESVSPAERPISASSVRTSTTASFRLTDIQGGHEYWISPTVNVSHRVGNHASIASDDVLLVVELTPSA